PMSPVAHRSFPTTLGHRRDDRTEEPVHAVRRSKHRGDVWVEHNRDRACLETSGKAIRSSLPVVESILPPHAVPIHIAPATSSPGFHSLSAPSVLPSGRGMPHVISRASVAEWSGSSKMRARRSPKTVRASSNDTPCFLRLAAAFRGSHSKLNSIGWPGTYHDRRSPRPANDRALSDLPPPPLGRDWPDAGWSAPMMGCFVSEGRNRS